MFFQYAANRLRSCFRLALALICLVPLALPAFEAPPVVSAPLTATGQVGIYQQITVVASNAPTTYAISNLPPGMGSATSASPNFTGYPTATGTYACVITATNSGGSGTAPLTVTILPATPVISISSNYINNLVGQPLSYQIVASNNPTTFAATNLPPGLTLECHLRLITGTPTATGSYLVTFSATNAGGTGTRTQIFAMVSMAPVITSATAASVFVGAAFTYQISAANIATSYNAYGLPPGLWLAASGLISGTPAAAGSYPAVVLATNAAGTGSATLAFTSAMPPIPVINSPATAAGNVGSNFTYTITAPNAPVSSYATTGLPPGLLRSGNLISGQPTATGIAAVVLTATNASGSATKALTVTILPALPVFTNGSTFACTAGNAMYFQMAATNSPTSFGADALPAGLTINIVTGLISGTPLVPQILSTYLSATNSGGTRRIPFTFTIAANAAVPLPALTSATYVIAYQNTPFIYQITASNTPTFYSTSGVPSGLSLNTNTGAITGTLTYLGAWSFPIRVGNAGGIVSATMTIHALPAVPVITSATAASTVVNTPFTYAITTANNPTSYTSSVLPTGLSLSATSGLITGTPVAIAISTVTITATNASGSGSATLTLDVRKPPPVISSTATATGQTGVAFAYTITGTNTPTAFSAAPIPAGLTFSATSGTLTGTPTSAGVTAITIGATNATGTGTATLTVTIIPPKPVITSTLTATAQVGTPFSYQIAATDFPTTWNATNLPPGLVVSATTGAITGTPTGTGVKSVTLSATNVIGAGTAVLVITTQPASPVITSATAAAVQTGAAFTYTITATNSPTSFTATPLPVGLTLSATTGRITGTVATPAVTAITITATNAGGTGTATLTLTATLGKPVITSVMPAANVGTPFSYQITATNSPSSYGATPIPAGLTFSATSGTITGIPTSPGVRWFSISATNATGTGTAAQQITVGVALPVITSPATAAVTVGQAFSYVVNATNAPISYGATNLPAGLAIDATSGAITGTPTTSGVFPVTLTATNAGGTASTTLTLTVFSANPVITSATWVYAQINQPYSFQVTATNSPTSFSSNGMPQGLTLSATSGLITGVPTEIDYTSYTVYATNAYGTGSAPLFIQVHNPPPVITSATSASCQFFHELTYTITATDHPDNYDASGLPAGFSIDVSNGRITGSPIHEGVYVVTLYAFKDGISGSGTLTLTLFPPPPSQTSANHLYGTIGVPFSHQVTFTGSPFSYGASDLPPGLSISATSGLITGTPTKGGFYDPLVWATNVGGTGYGGPFIDIAYNTPVITSPTTATGVVGVNFAYTITATDYSPIVFFSSTTLPAGLTLDDVRGRITGSPYDPGVYTVTIMAYNQGTYGSATLTITVLAKPELIRDVISIEGQVGVPFTYQAKFTNSPYAFGATNLPPGLSISATSGLITGTPTVAGEPYGTLTATNLAGTGVDYVDYIILPASPIITSAAAATAVTGTAFSYTITMTPGFNPAFIPASFSTSPLPAGLILNSATGRITGTPTVAGVTAITLTAINAGGTGSKTLTLTVKLGKPVITSVMPIANVGSPFTYQITATNGPTSYAATNLPAGLTMSATTGIISGTPTAVDLRLAGIYATNATGTGTASQEIVVKAPLAKITSATTANAQAGVAFIYAITATNMPTGFGAVNLPAGLSVNPTTGAITGSPTAPGTTVATITATNDSGFGSAFLTISVLPAPPVITSSTTPDAVVDFPFTYQITATDAPSAYAAIGLPAGLSINPASGIITGIPTASGTRIFTISATNSGGTGSATIILTVRKGLPVITSATSAAATTGSAFSYIIAGTNYPTSFSAFPLPTGLTLDPTTGKITGTVTTPAITSITITAANGGGIGTATLTLTVNLRKPVITSVMPGANVGTPFTHQITATNSPTSYSVTSLPAGLTVSATTGIISGTPTVAGARWLSIAATNAAGTATVAQQIMVGVALPVITSPATAAVTVGQAFSYAITATNAPISYEAANLPAGLTLNATTGAITGTPSAYGVTAVTLTATNAGGTTSATLTVTVLPAAAPVITSTTTAYAVVNQPFSFQITATNAPTSFATSQMPSGLTCSATGLITGVPTVITNSGVYVYATNARGTGSALLVLIVSKAIPLITSAATATGQRGVDFSYTITASDSPTGFTADPLPVGMDFDDDRGVISGVPIFPGVYVVTIGARSGSALGTATLTITVLPPTPTFDGYYYVQCQVGVPFTYQSAFNSSPTSYSASNLPSGLSISATGLITGTPTVAGGRTVILSATNPGGTCYADPLFDVLPAPPVISSNATAAAATGSAFTYTITATNIPTSYTATGLPAGLTINATTGKITGTPTTVAVTAVTITATNAGGTGTATLTLTVNLGKPVITSVMPAANVGTPFTYQITATNSPTSFATTTLPAGLTFSATTGAITGTPTLAGKPWVTVSAINATGTGATAQQFTIGVALAAITSPTTASGTVGSPFIYQIAATNAPSGYNATNLPPGLTVDPATGLITGTPTAAGTTAVTLSATNAGGTSTKTLTITISIPSGSG